MVEEAKGRIRNGIERYLRHKLPHATKLQVRDLCHPNLHLLGIIILDRPSALDEAGLNGKLGDGWPHPVSDDRRRDSKLGQRLHDHARCLIDGAIIAAQRLFRH